MSDLVQSLSEYLPALVPCEEFELKAGEVLIHAPGFEDRTMAAVKIMRPSHAGTAILLDYLPVNEHNRLLAIRSALSNLGTRIEADDVLPYDRFTPGDFETRLRSRLLAHDAQRAVVDISSMSKLALILVLDVCRRLDLEITVIYAEAEQYRPTEEEFFRAKAANHIHQPTLQVFTGVHGVVRVDSLGSVAMQGQPTAALVFMSFNDALTQVLLNTVYPSRLFLINGRPPTHTWREAATAWIHEQVRREWEDDNPVSAAHGGGVPVPSRAASTLDYRESVSLLLELYWQLSATHRVLLAPSGSKMQAVGCFIVKALHPDIHVEYPSPEGFAPEYSSGVAACWRLEFGNLSQLLAEISSAERSEYLNIQTA